ncbi:MAG TPA: sugar phosphate isomerase/epimerase family protein [Chloroflexota bacterium]|nr:sugar phosphate isomerase/epimerase family protein [Chloroflexota bacterium]
MNLPLGCMNRPYVKFPFERSLEGIAAAGFREYVLLQRQEQAVLNAQTAPEEAKRLQGIIEAHGLHLAMLPSSIPLDGGEEAAYASGCRLVDLAAALSVPYLLEMGTKPENFDAYRSLMRRLAPYAQEHGVTIAVKPHGGITTTGDDCLRVLQAVDHPAYRFCFDPGNLLHYANERPETHLAELAPYAVAMCIKDETGGLRGSVNVTPGDGDVDFPAVFRILRDAGFQGPCVIETLAARDTPEAVDAEARRAHQFLTGVLAAL